jgi:hypothetical protein
MACARGCECDTCFALGIGGPPPTGTRGWLEAPGFGSGLGGSGGLGLATPSAGSGLPTPQDWRDCYPDLAAALVDDGDTAFDARSSSTADDHGFLPQPSSTACGDYDEVHEPESGRILLAVSGDGVTWKKTGQVIVNHGSVPCLAVEGGVLYLFFCVTRPPMFNRGWGHFGRDGWGVYDMDDRMGEGADLYNGLRPTPLAVAYTSDLVDWVYRLIGDEGKGFKYADLDDENKDLYKMSANDPSVVEADDAEDPTHKWYLYYALHDEGGSGGQDPSAILVAGTERLSDFNWVTLPRTSHASGLIVFPNPDDDPTLASTYRAEDPSVLRNVRSSDSYRMFAGGNEPKNNWRVKTDASGEVVSAGDWDQFQETCDEGETILMNNGLAPENVGDDLTWFASVIPSGEDQARSIIRVTVDGDGAFTSGTGSTGGCRTVLEGDKVYEHGGIHEAAVAKFRGCWVMAYTTGIPRCKVPLPLMAGYPSGPLSFP